jgi:hypothetical protein
MIPIICPFAVWGLDMLGKFKTAPSGFTHLLVAVDKFTKWMEAKPIKKCNGRTATKFLRELIYQYGYPHSIITYNSTNFAKREMDEFCKEKGIPSQTAKPSAPIRASSMASSHAFRCPSRELLADGLRSSLRSCGEYGPLSIDQLGSPPSSWSMVPKRSCQQISNMTLP